MTSCRPLKSFDQMVGTIKWTMGIWSAASDFSGIEATAAVNFLSIVPVVVAVYAPWYWLMTVSDCDSDASIARTSLSWKQLARALSPFLHPGSEGEIASFSRITLNSFRVAWQSSTTSRRAAHALSSSSLHCACFKVILRAWEISGSCCESQPIFWDGEDAYILQCPKHLRKMRTIIFALFDPGKCLAAEVHKLKHVG